MRITTEQRTFLVKTIREFRPKAEIYLFGSRINDELKGGDIDVLVLDDVKFSLKDKLDFKRKFYNQFGEQKLDLITFITGEKSLFKDQILEQSKML
ncbi:MAG: putative nucleotidyltransferase [Cyclobacteriaceae bacterium]|jgi:predicted nucleotidyltransferase